MRKLKVLLSALLLAVTTLAFAQDITVKGVVTDASTGEPLSGAAILVKGTPKGVVADENGHYTVTVPANGTLGFTTIGFKDLEVAVEGRTEINVKLEPDTEKLDDVIVVAFGTTTRESFTGSAATVKDSDIKKTQSSDVTRALEGRVAGVQMTTSTGTLGSSPSIIIRGVSSINAGTSPLIVIDGVPYDGDLNSINNADVANISVLKDAASNALYGSRGANGVIMITTKKAQAGKFHVDLDAKVGWNTRALQDYDVFTDPKSYYEAHYQMLYNHYRTQGASAADAHLTANSVIGGSSKNGGLGYLIYNVPDNEFFIGTNGKVNPNATLGVVDGDYLLTNDNWVNETYRQSLRQEYNLSVSGSTQRLNAFASFGYLKDKGIIDKADMERFTARVKAEIQATKWLKLGANMNYAKYNYNNGNSSEGDAASTANIFGYASTMAPIYPVYIHNADGSIAVDERGNRIYDFGNGGYYASRRTRPNSTNSNPLCGLQLNIHNTEGNQFNATGFAEVTFLKHFKAQVNVGAGLNEARSTEMCNPYYGQFATTGGYVSKGHSRATYYNFQQLLTWDQTFGGHHASVMLGHENYKRDSKSLSASKNGMFSIDNLELDGCAIDGKNAASSYDWYNNEGYFARALYDFSERYFVSASYRRDASSHFAPAHRWGNFWSAGLGWNINRESWFNASWVDLLKVKASIGSQGNDNIGGYRYTDRYSVGMVDNQISVAFNAKGNENISWETNTNINAGVDFDFFRGRLSGTVEYFYRKTSDMLFFFSVPYSIGYGGYYDNIGDMSNSGVEISLNGTIIRTKDINWDIYLNGTHYKTKVLRIPDKNKTKVVEGYEGYASGNKFIGEGLPFNTYYMAKYAGVDKNTGLPLYYKDVVDANGNVTGQTTTDSYSDATDYLLDDVTPKFYGGFGTSFSWKGLDVSASFNYSIGGLAYDSGYAALVTPATSSTGHNFHKDVLNAWTVDNPNSDFPRFEYSDQNISASSSRFLTDASYLNLQNVQIGYTFPAKWTNKLDISKLRIYLTCDNVCYWSCRKGFDPRFSFSGATNAYVNSPVRTLSGGINITF